ncbi:MAG: hypothetical protein SGILL_008421 [Bacillariaceae sp.]
MDSNIRNSSPTEAVSQGDNNKPSESIKTDALGAVEDASNTIITAEGDEIQHNGEDFNHHDNGGDYFDDDDIAVAAEEAARALGEAESAAQQLVAGTSAPVASPQESSPRVSSKSVNDFAEKPAEPKAPTPLPCCQVCGRASVSSSGVNRPLLHFKPSRYVPINDNGITTYQTDVHVHLFCGKTAGIKFQKNPHSGKMHNSRTAQWEIVSKAGLKHKHGPGPETNVALTHTRSTTLPSEGDDASATKGKRKPPSANRVFYLTREFEANLNMVKAHVAREWAEKSGDALSPFADSGASLFTEVVNGVKAIPALTEEKPQKLLPKTKEPNPHKRPQRKRDENQHKAPPPFNPFLSTKSAADGSHEYGKMATSSYPGSPLLNGSPTTITTATTGTTGSPPASPLPNPFPPIFLGNGQPLPDDMNLMNFSSFPTTSVAIPPSGPHLGTSFPPGNFAGADKKPALHNNNTAGNKHTTNQLQRSQQSYHHQQQPQPYDHNQQQYHPPFFQVDRHGAILDGSGKVTCGCGGRYKADDGSATAKLSWRNHALTKQHQKWLKAEQLAIDRNPTAEMTQAPKKAKTGEKECNDVGGTK